MGTDLIVAESICICCRANCDRGDAFCRQCGAPLVPHDAAALAPAHAAAPDARRLEAPAGRPLAKRLPGPLLERRLVIAALLVTVGPLALPLLWLSPRFSSATKVTVSLLYFGLTVVFPLVMAWYWLELAVAPLVEVLPAAGR